MADGKKSGPVIRRFVLRDRALQFSWPQGVVLERCNVCVRNMMILLVINVKHEAGKIKGISMDRFWGDREAIYSFFELVWFGFCLCASWNSCPKGSLVPCDVWLQDTLGRYRGTL